MNLLFGLLVGSLLGVADARLAVGPYARAWWRAPRAPVLQGALRHCLMLALLVTCARLGAQPWALVVSLLAAYGVQCAALVRRTGT